MRLSAAFPCIRRPFDKLTVRTTRAATALVRMAPWAVAVTVATEVVTPTTAEVVVVAAAIIPEAVKVGRRRAPYDGETAKNFLGLFLALGAGDQL